MIDYEAVSTFYTLVQLVLWFPMLMILALMSVPVMLHIFVFHNAMPKYYNERNAHYIDELDENDNVRNDNPRNLRIKTRSFSE